MSSQQSEISLWIVQSRILLLRLELVKSICLQKCFRKKSLVHIRSEIYNNPHIIISTHSFDNTCVTHVLSKPWCNISCKVLGTTDQSASSTRWGRYCLRIQSFAHSQYSHSLGVLPFRLNLKVLGNSSKFWSRCVPHSPSRWARSQTVRSPDIRSIISELWMKSLEVMNSLLFSVQYQELRSVKNSNALKCHLFMYKSI